MITQERLKEVLDYDQDAGTFMWRNSGTGRPQSLSAGCVGAYGYTEIYIDGRKYKAHRLAILFTDGYMPENTVDHVNRVRSDNRRKNLREASRQCQSRNCGVRNDNTSGIKGVSWHKREKRWSAYIAVDSRPKFLGFHDSIMEAACHRYAAEQCLGFPDCDINSSAKKYIDPEAT